MLSGAAFELAVDAIVSGDVATLRRLLDADPSLVRQRSARAHHSTLLHYVSANGVEDVRQLTPVNILDVTRLLLDAGADVNATSEAYGGGSTTLGLVSTSAHPRAAGVQIVLMDALLAAGARIDGEDDLPALVHGAIANGCPGAAWALADRAGAVRTLYAAAAVGDDAAVRTLLVDAPRGRRESALRAAAMMGHTAVVAALLDAGVDVSATDGMTALHLASGGARLDTIALLLARGAPLEVRNTYGGTVLGSTLWFAWHVTDDAFRQRDYAAAVRLLLTAGAKADDYPDMARDIAGVAARAERLAAPSNTSPRPA